MNSKPNDLLAIANAGLAEKLNKQAQAEAQVDDNPALTERLTFEHDRWRAVFTLNLFRYALALFLLLTSVFVNLDFGSDLLARINHPTLFLVVAIIFLVSAIAFTYITHSRKHNLAKVLIGQFSVDLLLTALLVHATGSITSGFSMMFLLVVTTGSVVLRRKFALGLASGAIILMFYEHLYTVLLSGDTIQPRYDLLASYGIFLLVLALMISHLSMRIRAAESKSFVPGTEKIEEFLVREEKNALKSALESTNGNKTEAAKLLGMTFRSFRYKLTKFDIE